MSDKGHLMDSVSQFALGAAVAVAALGNRTRPWRAVLWGGIVGTLPDLDVLFDHGDAVRNMLAHRSESHAVVWLTLATPVLAFAIARLHRERHLFGRWCLAVWLSLVTHPLLDAMTIYGTRLLLPFADTPLGLGSLFIIDPAYTLPLLLGTTAFLRTGRRRWNTLGLVLSTAYAAWSVVAQQQALAVARQSLQTQGIAVERVLATATPLQTILWRLVATDAGHVYEAHWSLLDGDEPIEWTRIDRGLPLREALRDSRAVADLVAFTGGFWKLWQEEDRVLMADVRMGMEPRYVFTFLVGRTASPPRPVVPSVLVGARLDVAQGVPWLWRRLWGERVPPPR